MDQNDQNNQPMAPAPDAGTMPQANPAPMQAAPADPMDVASQMPAAQAAPTMPEPTPAPTEEPKMDSLSATMSVDPMASQPAANPMPAAPEPAADDAAYESPLAGLTDEEIHEEILAALDRIEVKLEEMDQKL